MFENNKTIKVQISVRQSVTIYVDMNEEDYKKFEELSIHK